MAAPRKVLMLCGDYMEDYEAAVPLYALTALGITVDCAAPGKRPGDSCLTAVHDFLGFELYTELTGHRFAAAAAEPSRWSSRAGGEGVVLVIVGLVAAFAALRRPVALTCHSQLLLAAAGRLSGGTRCTAFFSMRPVVEPTAPATHPCRHLHPTPTSTRAAATRTIHSLRSPAPLPPPDLPLSFPSFALSFPALAPVPFPAFLPRTRALAAALRASVRLAPGDVAFVLARAGVHVPVLYYALMAVGAVVSPVNPALTATEVSRLLTLDPAAALLYSSGTTGWTKAVVLTHRNLMPSTATRPPAPLNMESSGRMEQNREQ